MKTILLVDDNTLVRVSLRRLFEVAGWTVCGEASNGEEAIAKARDLKPDIMVLDLSMPVMNGLTAGHILKRIAPETPLILFTSFGEMIRLEDLRRAGFSALVDKNEAGKLVSTAQDLLTVH